MSALSRLYTYDDLLEMPDDGKRREVIGGELIVSPAPTAGHQRVLLQLILLLSAYARESGNCELFVAPFDVRFGPHDVVEPDLLLIATERGHIPSSQYTFEGSPDLVVEVISRSSRQNDFVRKMALYARAGVPEYWVADPETQTLIVNFLAGNIYVPSDREIDGTLVSRRFPGLRVDPSELFSTLNR
jgi:Uma2 family endonuclease